MFDMNVLHPVFLNSGLYDLLKPDDRFAIAIGLTRPHVEQGWAPDSALEYLQGAKGDVQSHLATLEELDFGVKLLKTKPVPVADMRVHEEVKRPSDGWEDAFCDLRN